MIEMFGLEALSNSAQAATTVGIVFTEAIALYIGYGAVTQIVHQATREFLGGE
ncbi:DUF7512 family protein [Halocatena marina]|uniref:DUF7512 family protein n=1 Tax=Halocatena marina TaxID=2934937 RepID=UPI004039ECCA